MPGRIPQRSLSRLLLAGRRFQSAAMRAITFICFPTFTTLGMLAGLAAVAATGALWLDSVIAIAIAVARVDRIPPGKESSLDA